MNARQLLVVRAAPVPAARLVHLLDDATADRLSGPRRDQRVSAHALLRLVLSERTGTAPAQQRFLLHCAACGGDHGKPVLQHPALHVSLTATASVVAVAVSRAGPVGVDAEQVDRAAFAGFSSVALGPGEHTADAVAAARAWARKEAVLKATGYGLALDPREVDVSRSAVSWPVPATVVDVPSPAGTACAAALLGPGRVELELGECSLP